MSPVSSPDATTLESAIAKAAEQSPNALAAYVFGSRASGEGRAHSDLDVAVLEAPGRSLDLEAEDRLRRVFARDDERADEIEEDLLLRYLDTEYRRRVQREYFFEDES